MSTNAFAAFPTASQEMVVRMGWFSLHGTAAFVPFLILIGVGIWIYSAHAVHARRREALRTVNHLMGRKH
jgi:hypothetical protein